MNKKINYRMPTFDDDDREYFQCDCHDRNHTIYACCDKLIEDGKILHEEITLRFVAGRYDGEAGHQGNFFARKYRQLMWRVKMAWRILLEGYLEYEDEWIPERRTLEQVRGKKDLVSLINWLAQKHIELNEREMEVRQFSTEELSEHKAFVEKWAFNPVLDKEN